MNRLLNGNFESGTDDWENGPQDYPFIWDSQYKWIRGDSPTTQDYKIFTIQQPVSLVDMVILAKITAWRRYESVAGNYVDGAVKARIKLQKPDSSWVTLAEEEKVAQTGSGNILDQYDILSHFSQQGNYKLMLQTESRASCDRTNHEVKVEEPYGPWANEGFIIEDPNCKVLSDEESQDEIFARITKTFSIMGPAQTATLTLDAKGYRADVGYPGYAHFKVSLKKWYESANVLYDGWLYDGNWITILNGLDIKSYLAIPGMYDLILESWVVSGYDGDETYYPSDAWFGNCELTAQWYTYAYTVSKGYWDTISLDILRKLFKTVVEKIGTSELTPGKKISIGAKEEIFLTESFSTKRLNVKKMVMESISMKESFYKKIYKIVKESIGLKELSYSGIRVGLNKSVTEKIFLAESFSWRKLIRKTIQESVSMRESLTAKKTAGNIITTYQIMDLTEWEPVAKVTTAWIKEKTVMNI